VKRKNRFVSAGAVAGVAAMLATSGVVATAGTASASGGSFTILGQWTGGELAAFQAVLSAFNKQSGDHGTYQSGGTSFTTVLGAKVNGGTPPDIAIVSLPGQIKQFSSGGKLQVASAASKAAVAKNFTSVWTGLGSVGGKLYGVPVDASDKSTVWYNGNLWKSAGLTSTPTTWTAFIKDANTIADSGVSPAIAIGGNDAWTLTDWFENIFLRTAGLKAYNQLTNFTAAAGGLPGGWMSPKVAQALTILNQVFQNKTLAGPSASALKVPFTGSVDAVFGAKPTSAIVYEASFVATTITSDKDPVTTANGAKFFAFPSVNGSKPVVEAAGDFAINFTKNPAAQAFMTYLASPAASKILVSSSGSGFLTANKNMAASAYPDPTSKALGADIIAAGNNVVFDMSDQAPPAFGGTVGSGEYGDLQTFLGNGNVAAAQAQLEKDAVSAYGGQPPAAS
jgi:alpha-glucoside transport system substrate-binding protein